jgi:hypothetical protein
MSWRRGKKKSGEEIDFVGDAAGRELSLRGIVRVMEECSTAGVSSQYLFMVWYSFELGDGAFELGLVGWVGDGGQDAVIVRTWGAACCAPTRG